MHRSIPSRLLPLLALLSLPAVCLTAQTTAPAVNETVELSPFTVTTSADRGYTVSESMTGSRVNTRIIDLPYTVNVMTSEFLEDFGLFELADNVTHTCGQFVMIRSFSCNACTMKGAASRPSPC
ncbi:MAG: hypothetical protein PSV13_15385 [Lacunisphaera sp.]|nr:hypothetical protein [Lacunisphaera sp.]